MVVPFPQVGKAEKRTVSGIREKPGVLVGCVKLEAPIGRLSRNVKEAVEDATWELKV